MCFIFIKLFFTERYREAESERDEEEQGKAEKTDKDHEELRFDNIVPFKSSYFNLTYLGIFPVIIVNSKI